jgi:hypothetical protein
MLKKTIATLVVGGALLGGVASAGTAYAAAPTATATASSSTAGHPLRTWLKAHRKEIRKAGIDLSAKTIGDGVTPKALVTELRSGKSVAQVAGEHNVSAQTVVNALVGAADGKVDQAVTSGKLTSAEAAKIKAALPGYITKAVNRTR